MANKRLIYQDFFEDDYFGRVEIGMRLLWIGLIVSAADDQGRMLDNNPLIRAKIFMYDGSISNDQIEKWLTELCEDRKIIRYEVDGKHLIQIAKWWEYQIPSWACESKYLPPSSWIDRVRCHVKGGKIKTINWDKEGGFQNNLCSEMYDSSPGDLTNMLPSILDNDLPGDLARPINEDKGKFRNNSEYKDKEENVLSIKNKNDNLFDSCKAIYETKKGKLITDGQAYSLMIENFIKNGVTAEDYSAAIDAMDADRKYKGNKPTSYETWAINYVEQRNNTSRKKSSKTSELLEEQTNKIISELIDEYQP